VANAQQKEKIDFVVMYATHDAFRRDLEHLASAAAAGRVAAPGVRAGWENFKAQLHVHHSVEDAELWPRVEKAIVGRPADEALIRDMQAEHAALDPVLDRVDAAIATNAADVSDHVRDLSTVLGDHMKHEEDSALPLIQEVLTVKDWSAFRGGMARAQGPKGAAIYIPWVMDDVGPEGRRKFLAAMPAPVGVANKLILESRYKKKNFWEV
jgi:iron-sulfur cluster repair protein YtfE (RIC family)